MKQWMTKQKSAERVEDVLINEFNEVIHDEMKEFVLNWIVEARLKKITERLARVLINKSKESLYDETKHFFVELQSWRKTQKWIRKSFKFMQGHIVADAEERFISQPNITIVNYWRPYNQN